jgi:hypothetical protein
MSEESRIQLGNKNDSLYDMKTYEWPPTEDQLTDIASSALNQSHDKDVKVLVYWDNPTLMILEPFHYGKTDYIRKKFSHNERTVEVIIGKED